MKFMRKARGSFEKLENQNASNYICIAVHNCSPQLKSIKINYYYFFTEYEQGLIFKTKDAFYIP